MDKQRELLVKIAAWLDPMHLTAPSYQDCCQVHKEIMALLYPSNNTENKTPLGAEPSPTGSK